MQTVRLNKSTLRKLAQLELPDLFNEVYRNHYWGSGQNQVYYSGSGSHEEKLVQPYIKQVRKFLSSFATAPVIVDLGCGDFNIGRQLTDLCERYHGCDVVESLVEYNHRFFAHDGIEFSCLDATRDKLPSGDMLIVRQVLQHLSNDAIAAIISQFDAFRYVILTEHLPAGEFVANIDKAPGPDSRLRLGSGVDITAPPFSLRPAAQQLLCEVKDSEDFPGLIRTMLYQMESPRL